VERLISRYSLSLNDPDRMTFIYNMLHRLNAAGKNVHYITGLDFNWKEAALTVLEFENLVIYAAVLEYYLPWELQKDVQGRWFTDDALTLSKPKMMCLAENCTWALFTAVQPFVRHNVFFDTNSLSVL